MSEPSTFAKCQLVINIQSHQWMRCGRLEIVNPVGGKWAKDRVAHFAIFEKLVFAINSRVLRNLMEHIEIKVSLDSKLQTLCKCSVRILNIFEVIMKTSFSKIAICTALP